MKKVKYTQNGKDRILCINKESILEFWYQPQDRTCKDHLFDIWFSPSVFQMFFTNGLCHDTNVYSLTLNQLHKIKRYHNPRVRKVVDLLPVEINRAICGHDDYTPASTSQRSCKPKRSAYINEAA